MAGIRIEGNVSGNVAEVANNALNVNLSPDRLHAGFNMCTYEIDPGSITNSRYSEIPYISKDRRMSVGIDTVLATYFFTATAQNTALFKHVFTTMTMTQSAGFLNINPGLATVSGNFAYLQTWKYFTLQGESSLRAETSWTLSAVLPVNQVFEWGFFVGTAGVVPTDGVFFRINSSGIVGVMSFSGTETLTATLVAVPATATVNRYSIVVDHETVSFWKDSTLLAQLDIPVLQAIPFLSVALPITAMMRNSGTVTGGSTIKIGITHVMLRDLQTVKQWSEQQGTMGRAYQGQDGDTMGSLAVAVNAAPAAAAALVNATAAAQFTGLGGVAQVLPTLTAGTDGLLFSYQNPVPAAGVPGKTLVITGIYLDGVVTTTLTGGPLSMVMTAAYGHTAVSLATAETGSFVTATTKAPRRVTLGTLGFVAAAAAGVAASHMVAVQFKTPLLVNPGEFFAISARNLGTVTTLGAVAFTANIDHYFE